MRPPGFRYFVLLWPTLLALLPCPGQDAPSAGPATAALIDLLPQLDDASAQLDILKGIRAGLEGQRQIAPPQSALRADMDASRSLPRRRPGLA